MRSLFGFIPAVAVTALAHSGILYRNSKADRTTVFMLGTVLSISAFINFPLFASSWLFINVIAFQIFFFRLAFLKRSTFAIFFDFLPAIALMMSHLIDWLFALPRRGFEEVPLLFAYLSALYVISRSNANFIHAPEI